jgi:hypothetical protein
VLTEGGDEPGQVTSPNGGSSYVTYVAYSVDPGLPDRGRPPALRCAAPAESRIVERGALIQSALSRGVPAILVHCRDRDPRGQRIYARSKDGVGLPGCGGRRRR